MQFFTNHQMKMDIQIKVANIIISNTSNIKFRGLILGNRLRWKIYSRELITKLNKACFALRAIKSLVTFKTITSIYFAYFHSLLTYGIMFWGTSPVSKDIFKI